MAKKKLKLEALSVNSFSTQLSDDEKLNINGGTTTTCISITPVTPTLESILSYESVNVSELYTQVHYTPCMHPNYTKKGNIGCPGGTTA